VQLAILHKKSVQDLCKNFRVERCGILRGMDGFPKRLLERFLNAGLDTGFQIIWGAIFVGIAALSALFIFDAKDRWVHLVLVVEGILLVVTLVLELQRRSTQKRQHAIDELSKLGWTVKPESDKIQFEIAFKPLPPMKDSAAYFRQLSKPFQLRFHGTQGIEGLHELSDIGGCTKIEINAGEFTDISELCGFSNLTNLIITQTPLSGFGTVDLSPLSKLTNLSELNLFSTRATDIAPIIKLTELRTLNLRDVPIRDLSPLVGLQKLESIDVTGTGVTSLLPLRNATNLKELGISEKQVADLVTLKKLANLKSLRIIEQTAFDFSPISELSNLEYLFVWGLPIFNLSPLRKLVKLQDIHLLGLGFGQPSVVTDVDALGDLKDLKRLTLGELQIGDLSFVSKLKNLVEINIGRLPVLSVEPLRGLTLLESVSLNTTAVTDISPLLDLPALSRLSVLRTPARADVLSELERRGVRVQR
jgi:Leucine-rich repeat (LRR) protein